MLQIIICLGVARQSLKKQRLCTRVFEESTILRTPNHATHENDTKKRKYKKKVTDPNEPWCPPQCSHSHNRNRSLP